MKILVTNLKTSTARREHVINEFKDSGLEFSFVDCVIGKDLSEEELNKKVDMKKINQYNREIEWFTKGVIGCTLTNLGTYRAMVENNIDMALLLEDDTIIPPNLKAILEEIEDKIQQGDVVLLFYLTHSTLKLKPLPGDKGKLAKFYIPQNPEVLNGGSAFVVTRKAAEQMMNYNTPVRMSPDNWRDFYQAKCIDRLICVYPQVINTADFETTLQYTGDSNLKNVMKSNALTRYLLKLKRKMYKANKQKVEIVK